MNSPVVMGVVLMLVENVIHMMIVGTGLMNRPSCAKAHVSIFKAWIFFLKRITLPAIIEHQFIDLFISLFFKTW